MEHEAIEELLGAYALNAVEPDEAVLIGAHIAHCSECRAEFEQHLEVAALLPASASFAPSSVWDTISGEIAVSEGIASSRRSQPPVQQPNPLPEDRTTSSTSVAGGSDRWRLPLPSY